MSWLKKIGTILLKAIGVATGLEPLLVPYLGSAAGKVSTVINDLTQIGQVVVQAEVLIQGTGTGATKLAAATPLIANIIKTSELLSGKKIANEEAFIAACGKIASGVADVLNSLDSSTIKS